MQRKNFKLGILVGLIAGLVFISPFWAERSREAQAADTPLALPAAIAAMANQLSAPAPQLPKARVAVMDFQEASGRPLILCAYWADHLTDELAKTKRVDLVDRAAVVTALAEKKFQLSELATAEGLKKAGNALAADWIILGTITEVGTVLELRGKAFSVKTGKLEAESLVRLNAGEVSALLATSPSAAGGQEILSVTFGFVAAIKTGGGEQIVPIQPGTSLHSGDKIKFLFKADRNCYVYILQYGTSRIASIIYPDSRIALQNPVKANTEYSIPPGPQWYFLDQNPGKESLFILASLTPIANLDRLVAQLQAQTGDAKAISASILDEINGLFSSRGLGGTSTPIDTLGSQGQSDGSRGAGDSGNPIDVMGTAGCRDIGGVTDGPPLPFQLNDSSWSQAQTNVLQAPGLVARQMLIEHLP